MNKPIEFLELKVDPKYPQQGTVTVRGLTADNYNENRVFHALGKRWVIQNWFGTNCMIGASFYFALQYDLAPNFGERVTHILRN